MERKEYNLKISINGRWKGSSIQWYETASEFTGYHRQLLEYFKDILRPEDTVCELACGSGTLSREIAKHVKHVYANELNEDAIRYINEFTDAGLAPNVTALPGDWKEVTRGKEYDVVAYSYFSAIDDDWEALRKIAKRHIIAISPSANNDTYHPRRETYDGMKTKLDALGVDYTLIPLRIDFGQPFDDRDEARKYLDHYYDFESEKEREEFIDRKMFPVSEKITDENRHMTFPETAIYFPKIKNIGIMILNMEEPGESDEAE